LPPNAALLIAVIADGAPQSPNRLHVEGVSMFCPYFGLGLDPFGRTLDRSFGVEDLRAQHLVVLRSGALD
jgi:hypothetical protein